MPSTGNFRRLVAGSTGQRKSILRNLVSSLIIHESITTTLAKAKAVQPYAEQVITMGKKYSGRRDQRDRATAYLYVGTRQVLLILGLENHTAEII
jgi:large subunit ribosomal protein L17